jgi:hypothetical protein
MPIAQVRFHDEANDTIRINTLLSKGANVKGSSEDCIAALGREFIGTPYVASTLEDSVERLTVNLDELDCTTYIETVMALTLTINEGRSSWRDFLYNLERLRYRNGTIDGYSSRLHYVSDWVVDNVHRGIFSEVTTQIPQHDYIVKTLDYMTSHRDQYPQLADSAQYERIKNVEVGYRSHRFPYIKRERLNNKPVKGELRSGDIIAIVTRTAGLDVSHFGIVIVDNGTPYLMHASSTAKSVVIDKTPLFDMLRRSRTAIGIRVFRISK